MPNDKYAYYCNTTSSGTNKQALINSYNAVYNLYYNKVIVDKNPNGTVGPTDITDSGLCTTAGGNVNYCPDGSDSAKAANAQFKNSDGTVTYNTLKFYLDDCATKLDATDNYYIADTSFNNIIDTSYNLLREKRNDLDMRMKEILGNNQSILQEDQNYIDGSVYTTLLWTVLATSLIYYTFTKI
jgi:hypothetical protein